jgi:hypothetical protein
LFIEGVSVLIVTEFICSDPIGVFADDVLVEGVKFPGSRVNVGGATATAGLIWAFLASNRSRKSR